jgi:hypothetical protein
VHNKTKHLKKGGGKLGHTSKKVDLTDQRVAEKAKVIHMHHHHFHHGEKDTQSEWKGRFQPQVDPPKRPAGFRGVDPAEFHHAQQKLPYYLTMRSNNPLPPVNMLGLQVSIKNFRLITRFRIRMQI